MRRFVTAIAAIAAAFGGATVVLAKSELGGSPERTVPGLQLDTALDRGSGHHGDKGPRFEVSAAPAPPPRSALDGRVYVIVSRDARASRASRSASPDGTPFWGRDVDAAAARPQRRAVAAAIATCSAIRCARSATCPPASTACRRS